MSQELPSAQETKEQFKLFIENFSVFCEFAKYDAEHKKVQYDELLIAGFTEKQALYLICGGKE